MAKIVINNCFGGFSLSEEAINLLSKAKGLIVKSCDFDHRESKYSRHDGDLVSVVLELGDASSGPFSDLVIKEISSSKYIITEYDGLEDIVVPEDIRWIKI